MSSVKREPPSEIEMPESPYNINTEYEPEFDAVTEAVPVVKPATPAKLPQEAAERGTEAPAHNPMSLRFAKEFDFTDDEIKGMTPKELDAAVTAAHRVWLKTSRDLSRNAIVERGGDKPAAPAAPVAPPSETKVETKAEEDEYAEFGDLHPQVIAAIKKGRDKDKAVIEGLQKKVEEADSIRQAQYREQVFDAVDAEFAKMPAEVKNLIGEGNRRELEAGSLQHAVRKHILDTAEKDTDATLTFAQKMHKAAKALVPGVAVAKVLPAEVGDENLPIAEEIPVVKKAPPKDTATGRFTSKSQEEREVAWEKGGTAIPTHRESPLPKGEKKALETARRIMQAKGLLSDEDMPDGAFLPSVTNN